MIFGDYPCCGGELTLAVPEGKLKFEKEKCPHCGAVVWHKLSRIDPVSFTEADFLKEYRVDEEKKQIIELNPPREKTPEEKAFIAAMIKALCEADEQAILYGNSTIEVPLEGLVKGLVKLK